MKKILIFLMLGMFFISFTSAWTWDNSVDYEKDDMVAVIENAFGLPLIGDILGKMTLTSHTSVDEVLNVMSDGERAVMIYNPSDWGQETISLGKVTFKNMKTEKEVNKDYYFAEGIYEETPYYNQECIPYYDKNIEQEIPYCYQVQDGTYMKRIGWKRLDNQKEIQKK